MKSLKRGDGRIDELPGEVLSHIISFLPLEEAVRTSILSKRWRYLYASISNIDFDLGSISIPNQLGFMDFLDRLFISRGRSPLDKFNLCCIRLFGDNVDALASRLEKWICAAIRLHVQQIDLYFMRNYLQLPSSLFTCATLVSLRLNTRSFEVPANVWLPSLKFLHLANSISFSSVDSAERLFSNCPVLENLIIRSYLGKYGKRKLTVSNSTLKRLTVQSVDWPGHCSFEIVINAPNLVYFKYKGCLENSHEFLNVQSLAEACIDFRLCVVGRSNLRSATDLMGGISNIHTLCLTSAILFQFKAIDVPFPLFPNLTNLRISFVEPFLGFPGLPNLLAQCHHLEILVLDLCRGDDTLKWNPDPWYELKDSGASCLLFGLKAIEVQSFVGGEDQMKMVEFFLESARVLEKLKIRIRAELETQFLISRELLKLPRVSQKCRIFIE